MSESRKSVTTPAQLILTIRIKLNSIIEYIEKIDEEKTKKNEKSKFFDDIKKQIYSVSNDIEVYPGDLQIGYYDQDIFVARIPRTNLNIPDKGIIFHHYKFSYKPFYQELTNDYFGFADGSSEGYAKADNAAIALFELYKKVVKKLFEIQELQLQHYLKTCKYNKKLMDIYECEEAPSCSEGEYDRLTEWANKIINEIDRKETSKAEAEQDYVFINEEIARPSCKPEEGAATIAKNNHPTRHGVMLLCGAIIGAIVGFFVGGPLGIFPGMLTGLFFMNGVVALNEKLSETAKCAEVCETERSLGTTAMLFKKPLRTHSSMINSMPLVSPARSMSLPVVTSKLGLMKNKGAQREHGVPLLDRGIRSSYESIGSRGQAAGRSGLGLG